LLVAALCTCALGVTGCGAGQEEGADKASKPHPREPISSQVAPFNAALEKGDCDAAARLTFSALREGEEPGAPATKVECEFLESPSALQSPLGFLQVLAGLSFERSQEYGTAAMMEGKAPDDENVAVVWALDVDGRFRYVGFRSDEEQQIVRPLTRGSEADAIALAFVRSIRAGGCDANLISSIGGLAEGGDVEAGCRAAAEDERFVSALQASPKAEPRRIGGTQGWAFYELATEDRYFTLVLLANPFGGTPEFGVYDVLPASP
jgi:hypothetical protein